MSTPKHTPLRHRMLREIGEDQVWFVPSTRVTGKGRYGPRDHRKPLMSSAEQTTVRRFVSERLASNRLQARPFAARPTSITKVGRSLLAEWDAAHPDPTV